MGSLAIRSLVAGLCLLGTVGTMRAQEMRAHRPGLETQARAELAIGEGMKSTLSLGMVVRPDLLDKAADAVQGIDRITSCAIVRDVQFHILDHNPAGERGKYFAALEDVWSARCLK